jgi:hypothetical protein
MMKYMFCMGALAFALGCCSRPSDLQKFSVRGVVYEIPRHDVHAMTSPKSSIFYVRVAPPGAHYHLVLDEFHHYLPNKLGVNVPTISRINDNRFGSFTVEHSKIGPVVCYTDPIPHFSCGFRLDDGSVRWSVLFDRDRLAQTDQIAADANAVVQAYKASHR